MFREDSMEVPTTSANSTEQETGDVKPKSRKRYPSNSSDDGLSTYADLASEEADEICKAWNRLVDTVSAEPAVMQQPQASSSSAEKCAETCGGNTLPIALWRFASIGWNDIPDFVEMSTAQPSPVVMAEILGLDVPKEPLNFSPRELKVLMRSTIRAVCYGIITHCLQQYCYESCVGCVISAPAQNSHDCLLWSKRYLCRKLSWLCGQIDFKNVLHVYILVAYSFNGLLITNETVDQILQLVTKVERSENSLKELNNILKPRDKPILEHVLKVIKNRSYKTFLTTINRPSDP